MKKIPTIFERDWKGDKSRVTSEINSECLWVFNGEGRATRKYDGTACMVTPQGVLYKRYDAKDGKVPPSDFIPAQESADPETGHWPGWVRVTNSDKWHIEAFAKDSPLEAGTYELCGPKVQGNPEHFEAHTLVRHGIAELSDVPVILLILNEYFTTHDIEGIVWHHPDGRMAKIKARDFGIKRGIHSKAAQA